MKDNPKKKEESSVVKIASDIGNAGVEASKKVGTIITEFFTGKQPTKEEKEAIAIKKSRLKELKSVQEEVLFKRDMELAKRGQYVFPIEPKKENKKVGGMFSNLGKNDPLKGMNSLESNFNIGRLGSGNTPNFGLDGFIGTKNPMELNRKRRK